MHPVLFDFWLPVHTYGVLIALAFLVSTKLASDRANRRGIPKEFVLNVVLAVLIASVLGARLLYVVENWGYFQNNWIEILLVHRGGLSYFGGLAAGLAAGLFHARKLGPKIWDALDSFMPALAMGQAIGRLGCYFNGCCWGVPFPDGFAIVFPPASAAFAEQVMRGWIDMGAISTLPVFPSQLVSSFLDVLLFCLLVFVDDRRKSPGTTFFSYLAGYGLLRFSMEFLRQDSPILAWSMTLPQIFSLIFIVSGASGLIFLLRERQ